MTVILTGGAGNSYVQLISVLLIFVVVLGATALTTKWIAGYQKEMGRSGNIELMDAVRLGNNKYIQIVRVGKTYVALAVCKDTVTVLCEIPQEQLQGLDICGDGRKSSFWEILKMVSGKNGGDTDAAEEPEKSKDVEE